MDEHLARRVLLAAAKTPAVVDDLYIALEVNTNPYGIRALDRLQQRLAEDSPLAGDDARELVNNTKLYFRFLEKPTNYPADIRQDLLVRFPPARLNSRWTAPPGFAIESGFFARMRQRRRNLLLAMTTAGAKWPRIEVSNPARQAVTFPWVHVFPINDFLRFHGMRRLSSAYVAVGGSTAYEICYKPSDHPGHFGQRGPTDLYREAVKDNLEYAMVLVVTDHDEGYQITFTARSLQSDKARFDEFITTL